MRNKPSFKLYSGDTFKTASKQMIITIIEVISSSDELLVEIKDLSDTLQPPIRQSWSLKSTVKDLLNTDKSPYCQLIQREALTRMNFWAEIEQEYPDGYKIFLEWIVAYKKRVKWNDLFNSRGMMPNNKQAFVPYMADLPFAFQIGIFIEFVCERDELIVWEIDDMFSHDWREQITEYFRMLQNDENK